MRHVHRLQPEPNNPKSTGGVSKQQQAQQQQLLDAV